MPPDFAIVSEAGQESDQNVPRNQRMFPAARKNACPGDERSRPQTAPRDRAALIHTILAQPGMSLDESRKMLFLSPGRDELGKRCLMRAEKHIP